DGVYQIYVTDIIPDGVGSVYIANQQLREKLRKEGIFDESAKRPVPQLPKKIGAVTSETGAALQDIINVLSRRYPVCELMVFNTLVQGTDAADSISRSMMNAAKADCDVIILARGGGSLEDLSAFNTEKVAYAIYNSSVPVISAVGHETDVTIADLVADLRAPTPSAAAEMVSLSAEQIYGNIKYYEEKLKGLIETCLNNLNAQLEKTNERLLRFSPDQKIEKSILKYGELTKRLDKAYEKIISEKENKFISSVSKLEAMSPVSVLMRGYSLVYRNDRIVNRTSELTENDNVTIRLSDGKATAKIISLEGK
ncbi:MAG: exodeoxyribonuclease VII large subunit, partial [Oscillospiraceae bacterium]